MKKANAFVSNAFILCASTVEKDSCFFVKLRRISLRTLQAPSDSHVWFGISVWHYVRRSIGKSM